MLTCELRCIGSVSHSNPLIGSRVCCKACSAASACYLVGVLLLTTLLCTVLLVLYRGALALCALRAQASPSGRTFGGLLRYLCPDFALGRIAICLVLWLVVVEAHVWAPTSQSSVQKCNKT